MNEAWRRLGLSVVLMACQDYAKLLRKRDKIVQTDTGPGRMDRLQEADRQITALENQLNSHYFGLICPEYDTTKLAGMVSDKYHQISMRTRRTSRKDGDNRKTGDGYYNPNPKPRGGNRKHGKWAW